MKWNLLLIAMLLLSACDLVVGSDSAICEIPRPNLDASGISTENLIELDLFVERFESACGN
ncbi:MULTISPECIES: hypothetical protein [Pseudomonadota]|uniref:hypothetical protein n=1 Tax=Pseudomonadota TaxID=1224 RepID=UPI0015686F54|nr:MULTISPECIES: hypothetical protein [Pseudomonadota]NRP35213.1 hypothetical protein [Aliiroseovarius sp. xm-a-104]NRP53827.1 hypothetical protein [Marinobacterium sp. xm-v-242]NRP78408.1 hypothetical protein [Marinobacterium sp. xm-m-383]NRP84101.1 hypothetical protein [Marinobacterium sp. xm-d-509]